MIDTILCVNNEISSVMAQGALKEKGIGLDRVAVIVMRKLDAPWLDQCTMRVDYGVKPSFRISGQLRLIGYFRRASRMIRQLLATGNIRHVLLVNNDNVLNNHFFSVASAHPEMEISVLAEGIMNFQDIQMKNRDWWRTAVKPVFARILGLSWREPTRHVSGSLEPETRHVYTFAAHGVVAPPEKIRLIKFPEADREVVPDPGAAVIAMTGLHLWMTEANYAEFAQRFISWKKTLPFTKYYVKRHPRATDGPLFHELADCEVIGEGQSIEDMAGSMPGSTVIGFCCTGLVTLSLMRPDIRCLDFGSDFYCDAAYFGDRSVERLLEGSGVELISSAPFAN
ncbi:hypothetical protein SAMN05518801_11029 [Novosphingobium sp. CF614]|uniref:hypothetical protein n=1 Tax=Novosphingobium sp. CF614 TaxID=1884364 RepID=UPI0008E2D31B|nr:hypothetical protein [Novosphingobium sp. CF614]SFG19990.1 hypothetical protein SAMN05518801_11029 [Novosphingobium sp. CF614]